MPVLLQPALHVCMLQDCKCDQAAGSCIYKLQNMVMLAMSCCIGKLHMGLGLPVQIGDKELVASASADCTVRLWPLGAGRLSAEAILYHTDQVMHPALLGPARLAPQTSGPMIHPFSSCHTCVKCMLMRIPSQCLLPEVGWADTQVTSMAWDAATGTLATSCLDNICRLWQNSGTAWSCCAELKSASGRFTCMCFPPADPHLVTGAHAGNSAPLRGPHCACT